MLVAWRAGRSGWAGGPRWAGSGAGVRLGEMEQQVPWLKRKQEKKKEKRQERCIQERAKIGTRKKQ